MKHRPNTLSLYKDININNNNNNIHICIAPYGRNFRGAGL